MHWGEFLHTSMPQKDCSYALHATTHAAGAPRYVFTAVAILNSGVSFMLLNFRCLVLLVWSHLSFDDVRGNCCSHILQPDLSVSACSVTSVI